MRYTNNNNKHNVSGQKWDGTVCDKIYFGFS